MLCILLSTMIVTAQTSPPNPELEIQQLTNPNTTTNASLYLLELLNNASKSQKYTPTTENQQRALTIQTNVLNINPTKYNLNLNNEETTDRYFGLPQTRLEYTLTSEQDSMRITYTYTNTKLHQIYISDWTNQTPQTQTTELENTKTFLTQYKTQTNDPLYDTLRTMLTDVAPEENLTKTQDNIKLDITHIGDASTSYIWTYIDPDGHIAQTKNVVISYDHNRFQCFQDNWNLYQITGTPKLTEKQATEIALTTIQNYQYVLSTEEGEIAVGDFKVATIGDPVLSYLNEFGADTRGDAFELYPSWYVPIGFDKIYRGGITGVVVRVWADSGQVSSINPMIFNIDNPETPNPTPTTSNLLLPVALFVAMLGTTMGCCTYASVAKKRSLKVWKALPICGLILLSLFAATTQPVTATDLTVANPNSVNSKAEVYASYWEQSAGEQSLMSTLTSTIQARFSTTGYDTARYCPITSSLTVYANIASDKIQYTRTAVFHFGHMADAGNYRLTDTSTITYLGVDNVAGGSSYQDKHFFAFMWACNTASGAGWAPDPNRLAKSWSQRSNMAIDGFNYPDTTIGSCFIGFNGSSPMLGGAIYRTTAVHGSAFIDDFYWFALPQGGYTIKDSLNQASLALFGIPFDQTPLWTGTTTYFPELDTIVDGKQLYIAADWYDCRMMVFGNSGLYLRQYYPYLYYDCLEYGGFLVNPYNLNGAVPNGAYAEIWAWRAGDAAAIISTMTGSLGSGSGFSRGHIYLYGYAQQLDIPSCVYVYGSKVGFNDWVEVTNGYITSETPTWYDIGYANDFKYIAIACYNNDSGWGCNIMVDTVRVIP